MHGPSWLDEIRLEPGPPFSTMGTRALAPEDWLVVDDRRQADLQYKARLLESARPVVFAALPGSEDPAAELLGIVRGCLRDRDVDIAPDFGDDHPLLESARLVSEDLVVLQRVEGSWVLTCGVVCFPTHWTIADKLGMTLAGIHAPVAHYERELRERVDRFHDRLTPDRPVWRRNWFVVPTNELHLPAHGPTVASADSVATTIAGDGSPMWIRSERQTLSRLPRTGAIVFTILVQQTPLGVLRERRDLAARMLASLRSWDGERRLYTSTGGAIDELLEWLGALVGDGARPHP